MKILFVGDPHLDSQNPISRIDDYRETTINKLGSILDLCISRSIEYVIFAGDMFHRYDISTSYLVNVISKLNEFKDNNIELYSLIGNHDLPHDNMEYFDRTPLNLLFTAGIVKHLDGTKGPLRIDMSDEESVDIYGLDFTRKLKDLNIIKNNNKKFLVMHYATDNTISGEGSIPREELTEFDVVMSGHDHMYYPISGEKPIMLRPGSLTRRTKDFYNLVRDIIVCELDLDKDEISELILLGVAQADKVFKNEVFSGASAFNDSLIDFSEAFSKLYEESKVSSIYDIIDWLISHGRITKDSGDAVKSYLTQQGISK